MPCVADGVDLFAMGNSRHLLELNTTVLCGTDPNDRAEYARHLQMTEQRFYGSNRTAGFGI